MLGMPKYNLGDKVIFCFDNGKEKLNKQGEIRIVDAYGIFGDSTQVYYDIDVIEDGRKVLYKHIPESEIVDEPILLMEKEYEIK